MWELLKNRPPAPPVVSTSPSPDAPATEGPDTVQATQPTPPLPPIRFGATRIKLAPDPEASVITIRERKTETNHSDYVVHITQEIRGESTYYAELLTLLRTLTASSRVDIYISSPGGSLNGGAMIAAAIKASQARVTTVAMGVVASAATLIWSYGHERRIADGAVAMFHMSSHGDWGNSQAIAIQAANTVRYVKEVAIDPLVAQGLLTAEEAETIIDRRQDLWLNSTQIAERLQRIAHGQAA